MRRVFKCTMSITWRKTNSITVWIENVAFDWLKCLQIYVCILPPMRRQKDCPARTQNCLRWTVRENGIFFLSLLPFDRTVYIYTMGNGGDDDDGRKRASEKESQRKCVLFFSKHWAENLIEIRNLNRGKRMCKYVLCSIRT